MDDDGDHWRVVLHGDPEGKRLEREEPSRFRTGALGKHKKVYPLGKRLPAFSGRGAERLKGVRVDAHKIKVLDK